MYDQKIRSRFNKESIQPGPAGHKLFDAELMFYNPEFTALALFCRPADMPMAGVLSALLRSVGEEMQNPGLATNLSDDSRQDIDPPAADSDGRTDITDQRLKAEDRSIRGIYRGSYRRKDPDGRCLVRVRLVVPDILMDRLEAQSKAMQLDSVNAWLSFLIRGAVTKDAISNWHCLLSRDCTLSKNQASGYPRLPS